MPNLLNSVEKQESSAIMSAVKRYFGDGTVAEPKGAESNLLEALRIYFRDQTE